MEELDLANNQIGDDGAQCIANVLLTNNVRISLFIFSTHLFILSIQTLSNLSIEANNIGPVGFEHIVKALKKNIVIAILIYISSRYSRIF